MKKLILLIPSIFILCSSVLAQTTSEAYQFSNNQLYGTARFNGLSGAFGALGGDLSAISENPAASAIFINSFGSVTFSQEETDFTVDYLGAINESNETISLFSQLGGVLILNEDDPSTHVKKIAISFNYNKTNDFDAQYRISGTPGNTIGDFFVGQANGIPNGDLEIFDGETISEAYVAVSNTPEYGAVGQQAFLGFQSGLIQPVAEDDANISSYVSNADGGTATQDTQVATSGSASKASFNLAAAYESGLHLGVNLNLHTLSRVKDVSFAEENNFSNIQYRISEKNTGAGISGDIGLIYKTKNNLRLGLVYQTPTYLSIITTVDQFLISGDENIDPEIVYEHELYTLLAPGKFAASAAYIFGRKGLLSFEYTSQDFSNMEYGDNFSGAKEINNLIENTFQRVSTYKAGVEIRNNNWTLRGGLSLSTTPYEDDNLGGDSKGFSLGTGYDWGQWRIDFAYNRLDITNAETTFENNLYSNTANVEEKRNRITATLGVSF